MKNTDVLSALLLAGIIVGGVAVSGSLAVPAGAADGSSPARITVYSVEKGADVMTQTVVKTKEEWKKALTPEQYHILREKGTERAFSGKYDKHHEHGVYRCAACGLDLYRSEEKYDSGTGWPSFTAPVAASNILSRPDNSFFSQRTEVICAGADPSAASAGTVRSPDTATPPTRRAAPRRNSLLPIVIVINFSIAYPPPARQSRHVRIPYNPYRKEVPRHEGRSGSGPPGDVP